MINQEVPAAFETPHVVITEQPHSQGLRFRYECENEGRSVGSIPGVRSTPEDKTFPTIEVRGYKGPSCAVVSCVTKDPPYYPHPHILVGKDGCKKGVCSVKIDEITMSHTFPNLGVQCARKKDIAEALRLRKEIRVDPFRTGFNHVNEPAKIDLSAIRLCFQVFLDKEGQFTPLQPVVSDVIYDKKAIYNLIICELSDVSAPVDGGKRILLFCDKVTKEDIKVRFYEEQDGFVVWEEYGKLTNVHKQCAISFETPPYRALDIEHPVMVNIQLMRPSDGATSKPRTFELTPLNLFKQKKRKLESWGETSKQMLPALRKVDSPVHQEQPVNTMTQQNINDLIQQLPGPSGLQPVWSIQLTGNINDEGLVDLPNLMNPGHNFQPDQYAFPTLSPMVGSSVYHEPPGNTINQPGPSGLQPAQQIQFTGSVGDDDLDDILRMTGLTQLNISVSEEQRIQQEAEELAKKLITRKTNDFDKQK